MCSMDCALQWIVFSLNKKTRTSHFRPPKLTCCTHNARTIHHTAKQQPACLFILLLLLHFLELSFFVLR